MYRLSSLMRQALLAILLAELIQGTVLGDSRERLSRQSYHFLTSIMPHATRRSFRIIHMPPSCP